MATALLNEFERSAKDFIEAFSPFSQEEVNTIPFEGSWTPAQVAQHILMSATGVGQAMNGPTIPAGRPADQNVQGLKDFFLDFSSKVQAPDFVVPPAKEYDREELDASLLKAMDVIGGAIRNNDLTGICTSFTFPGGMQATGLEMAWFITVHMQRHAHQLRKIRETMQEMLTQRKTSNT